MGKPKNLPPGREIVYRTSAGSSPSVSWAQVPRVEGPTAALPPENPSPARWASQGLILRPPDQWPGRSYVPALCSPRSYFARHRRVAARSALPLPRHEVCDRGSGQAAHVLPCVGVSLANPCQDSNFLPARMPRGVDVPMSSPNPARMCWHPDRRSD